MLNLTHTFRILHNVTKQSRIYIQSSIQMLHIIFCIICRFEFILWQPHLTVATYYYDYYERVVSEFPHSTHFHREQSFQIAFQSLCFLSKYPQVYLDTMELERHMHAYCIHYIIITFPGFNYHKAIIIRAQFPQTENWLCSRGNLRAQNRIVI